MQSIMEVSTISAKGQTTIPVQVQKSLNLKSGDKLQYIIKLDGSVKLLPKTLSIKDIMGVLPNPQKIASLEEINEAASRAVAKKYQQ